MCEAVQVNLGEIFFKVLEKKLNEIDHNHWEVINLGVGDFGTTQELIALNEYGFSYSPDVVVCEIFPLNDICNNAIDLYDLCNSNNDRYRPYFLKEGNRLKLTTAQPLRNFLRRYLISYGVLERTWLERTLPSERSGQDALRDRHLGEKGFPALDPLLYTYASDADQLKPISKGWQMTELILKKIIEECRERKIPFIGVVVPFEGCVGERSWRAFTAAIHNGPKLIQDYPETRLDRFFSKNHVPGVLLKGPFETAVKSVLPYIDGHLNPAGHQIMGDEIFSKMLEQGFLHPSK
jgi:hypothetical protein